MISIIRQPVGPVLSDNDAIIEVAATNQEGEPFRFLGPRLEVMPTSGRFPPFVEFFVIIVEPNGVETRVEFITGEDINNEFDGVLPENGDPFNTDLEYWIAVAAAIQSHERINPLLTVFATQNPDASYSIWISARIQSNGWLISTEPDTPSQWTELFYPDPSDNTPIGHKLVLETLLLSPSGWIRVARSSAPTGANSRNRFNIREVFGKSIRALLNTPLVLGWSVEDPYTAQTDYLYSFKVSEVSEDPDYPTESLYTNHLSVVAGGVANTVDASTNYLQALGNQSSLMTWRDDHQKVSADQPYFLSWFAILTGPEVTPGVLAPFLELTQYDESNNPISEYIGRSNPLQVDQGAIATFNVGTNNLAIASTTAYYKVRVVSESNELDADPVALSPWRTFWVDRNYHIEERYLVYTNSFFCPEVVRCTGDLEKEVEFSYSESRAVRNQPTTTQVQLRNHDVDWKDIFLFNTGFITEQEADVLAHEIPLAHQLYEISPDGFIPLKLENKSFRIASSRQNLRAIELEATPAILEGNYSRRDEELALPPQDVWGSPDGIGIWSSPIAQPWH
ncbi:MAG: hypothetical protein AAFY91_02070 [Bacteroidota bacterium]